MTILGSMEFACKVSGAKVIAVIGHSNCGAIKGAAWTRVELGNLTGLLAKVKPATASGLGAQRRLAAHLPKTSSSWTKVSEANVHLVMQQIRDHQPRFRKGDD